VTRAAAPRVAFVVYDLEGPGGMQRQALRLAGRLEARGLSTSFVTTAAPRDLPGRALRPVPGLPGAPVLRVPTTRPPLLEAAATAWLGARGRPDLLYAVGWSAALHALRIGAALGRPVVVKYVCAGAHGDFAQLAATGGARRLAALARHVCISGPIRDEALAAGMPAGRLVEIPNGIDAAPWEAPAAPAPLPWSGPTILALGRLTAQKRFDVLLDAFARVVPRVPDARLAIAGEGPLQGELEARAARLGVAGQVAFLGQRADVLALHRAARAFALASEGEGLSNALLEALAAGTPVVVTDVPGVREVVTHDASALIAPCGAPDALAAALVRVLVEPALAARLAAAGRARVREAFDLDRVAARYAALFEEVAAERRTSWRARLLGERGAAGLRG
jgi:glycosyltransferase involved in cell wall biosynthesis